ncbi:MAG: zinc-ribbon domain containing protein [Chloroflexota bacterium]
MQDKTLTCRDCGTSFVFTAGEQEFYASKGFSNEPTRCPGCRATRKRSQGGGERTERQMFDAVCAECGKDTRVPFEPRSDRPVYCSDCFETQRSSRNRW